jgi:hypothetical protein
LRFGPPEYTALLLMGLVVLAMTQISGLALDTPIYKGKLATPLDGNEHSISNVADVVTTGGVSIASLSTGKVDKAEIGIIFHAELIEGWVATGDEIIWTTNTVLAQPFVDTFGGLDSNGIWYVASSNLWGATVLITSSMGAWGNDYYDIPATCRMYDTNAVEILSSTFFTGDFGSAFCSRVLKIKEGDAFHWTAFNVPMGSPADQIYLNVNGCFWEMSVIKPKE